MTNRKALKITNGSVYFQRDLIRFGKKKKKTRQEKLKEQDKQFYPNSYYGIKNT